MTEPTCFLLFEDTSEHATLIATAIAERATEQERIEIVWFDGPFSKPLAGLTAPNPYPVQPAKAVMEIINNRVISKEPRRLAWWQCDFDAAILDVFDAESGTSAGYDFAAWLDKAFYRGPVVVASINPGDAARFPSLKSKFISKQQALQAWTEAVAECVLPAKRLAEPRVNFSGRSPETLLSDFFRTALGGRRPWLCAYFGRDRPISEQASTFFSLDSFDNEYLHDMQRAEEILAGAERLDRKPKVLFFDCDALGGCLTDDVVALVKGAVEESTFRPISLLLTNKSQVIDPEPLSKINAAIINRDQFADCPSLWANDAITTLTDRYERYKHVQRSRRAAPASNEISDARREVFAAVHGPFAMARSVDKLASGPISLAAWVSGRNALTTNFAEKFRELVRDLRKDGAISEDQASLFLHAED